MTQPPLPIIWQIRLPYTKPPLSLNQRTHWSTRARTTKQVRGDALVLIRAAAVPPLPAVHVQMNYRPARNGRRDADNLIATQKPFLDALTDAGVIPDDTDEYLSWSRPIIHPADKNRGPAIWLDLTERTP